MSGTSLNDKPLSISLHEGYNKDKKSDKKSDSEKNSGDSGDSGSNESGGGDTAAAAAGSKQQRAGGGSGSSKKPAAAGGGGSNNTQQSVVVSVKVRNLAWSTTADGLAEHFKGCQVCFGGGGLCGCGCLCSYFCWRKGGEWARGECE